MGGLLGMDLEDVLETLGDGIGQQLEKRQHVTPVIGQLFELVLVTAVFQDAADDLVTDMMQSDIRVMQKETYLKDGGFQTKNYFE